MPIGRAIAWLAERDPDRPAITDDEGTVTRLQLHQRTNRLARAYAALGVGQDGWAGSDSTDVLMDARSRADEFRDEFFADRLDLDANRVYLRSPWSPGEPVAVEDQGVDTLTDGSGHDWLADLTGPDDGAAEVSANATNAAE